MCRRVRVCRCSRPNRCCIAFSYHKWSTRSFYSTSIHGVHSSLGCAPPPPHSSGPSHIIYCGMCCRLLARADQCSSLFLRLHTYPRASFHGVIEHLHAVLPSRPSLFYLLHRRRPKTTLTPLRRIYARTALTNCTLASQQNPRDVSNLKSCFCSYSTG